MPSFGSQALAQYELIERFTCAVCGAVHEQTQVINPQQDVSVSEHPRVEFGKDPGEWRREVGHWVCGKHTIQHQAIIIDHKHWNGRMKGKWNDPKSRMILETPVID